MDRAIIPAGAHLGVGFSKPIADVTRPGFGLKKTIGADASGMDANQFL